jgi:hypothetical protein
MISNSNSTASDSARSRKRMTDISSALIKLRECRIRALEVTLATFANNISTLRDDEKLKYREDAMGAIKDFIERGDTDTARTYYDKFVSAGMYFDKDFQRGYKKMLDEATLKAKEKQQGAQGAY